MSHSKSEGLSQRCSQWVIFYLQPESSILGPAYECLFSEALAMDHKWKRYLEVPVNPSPLPPQGYPRTVSSNGIRNPKSSPSDRSLGKLTYMDICHRPCACQLSQKPSLTDHAQRVQGKGAFDRTLFQLLGDMRFSG